MGTGSRSSREDLATESVASSDLLADVPVAFALNVVQGPDSGRSFLVDSSGASRLLVGQSPACDIRLSDRRVSRRHASVEVDGQRLRIRDLGSTNGTSVDDVNVLDARLRGGETVAMGGTTFRVERKLAATDVELPDVTSFGRVVGASQRMRRLYVLCERLAVAHVPVIIEGETGTGKELLAEALHETGPRRANPFVVFDCTSVPDNLMESELFGHERGAFTGAVAPRRGVFELAHGGTLLIDEIGDLGLALQPKLLRAVERSEVRRLGGSHPVKFDVRVLVATRRDLDHEVQEGRFRDDLYHRLAVGRVELPPLRERKDDVPLLARHFWHELGGPQPGPPAALLVRWTDDDWPGNVRELRNAVARHLALGELAESSASGPNDDARVQDDFLESMLARDLPLPRARQLVVNHFERLYIERILAHNEGNVARAAAASGIARRYFQLLRARSKG